MRTVAAGFENRRFWVPLMGSALLFLSFALPSPASAQNTCALTPLFACASPSAACVGTPVGADIACQCFNNAAGFCRCCSQPSGGSPCTVECTRQGPAISTIGFTALLLGMVVFATGLMLKRRDALAS